MSHGPDYSTGPCSLEMTKALKQGGIYYFKFLLKESPFGPLSKKTEFNKGKRYLKIWNILFC